MHASFEGLIIVLIVLGLSWMIWNYFAHKPWQFRHWRGCRSFGCLFLASIWLALVLWYLFAYVFALSTGR